jgi:hypothetical protein
MTNFKPTKPAFRTTLSESSVASNLTELISVMDKHDLPKIKSSFLSILKDKAVHISEKKAKKYEMDVAEINNKTRMMGFITNIYLKGDGLGLS